MPKKSRLRNDRLREDFVPVHEDWHPCFDEVAHKNGTVSGKVRISLIHTPEVPGIWRVFVTGADDFALYADVSSLEEAEWLYAQALENTEQDYLRIILGFEEY